MLGSLKKKCMLAHWVITFITPLSVIHAAENSDVSPTKVFMNEVDQLTPDKAEQQLRKLSAERQNVQQALVTKLTSSSSKQGRMYAVVLLGIYRMEQSVNTLAEPQQLTLENEEVVPQDGESLISRYPAIEALIRIGKPSVPAMLRNLEMSDDEHVRGLSARVIFYIEGPEFSKLVVENAVKAQVDPEKKKRLESALPLVKGGEYQKPQKTN